MTAKGLIKVLKNTEFLKLWIGQLISNIGDEVGFLGLAALVVFKWGASPMEVSMLFVFTSIPSLLFGPIAGVFVDRWKRKTTMICADLIRALLVFLIIFSQEIWEVYILIFLLASASRFFYPARNALIPNIVDKAVLVEANSLSQMTFMLSLILGPAIAMLIIVLVGYRTTFIIDSITFVFSAIMILMINVDERIGKYRRNPIREMIEGFSFIKKTKVVLFIILLFSFLMLIFGGLNVGYPIYIRDVLKMDVVGLGGVEFAVGIGAVLGSISVGVLSGKVKTGYITYSGIISIGILLILFAAIPVFYAVIVFAFLLGFFNMFTSVPLNALLQKKVPDDFRGKVFGTTGAMIQGASLISMGLIGLLITLLGIINVLLIAGIIVTIVGFLFVFVRSTRDILNEYS